MHHLHDGAAAPGLAAPEQLLTLEKQTPAVGAGAARDQENEHYDSASTAAEKHRATLTAELAMRGHSLLELADGSFMVTRWHCCRTLPDLRAVAAFLRQIGGAA